jgi:hypothetical protein
MISPPQAAEVADTHAINVSSGASFAAFGGGNQMIYGIQRDLLLHLLKNLGGRLRELSPILHSSHRIPI